MSYRGVKKIQTETEFGHLFRAHRKPYRAPSPCILRHTHVRRVPDRQRCDCTTRQQRGYTILNNIEAIGILLSRNKHPPPVYRPKTRAKSIIYEKV